MQAPAECLIRIYTIRDIVVCICVIVRIPGEVSIIATKYKILL